MSEDIRRGGPSSLDLKSASPFPPEASSVLPEINLASPEMASSLTSDTAPAPSGWNAEHGDLEITPGEFNYSPELSPEVAEGERQAWERLRDSASQKPKPQPEPPRAELPVTPSTVPEPVLAQPAAAPRVGFVPLGGSSEPPEPPAQTVWAEPEDSRWFRPRISLGWIILLALLVGAVAGYGAVKSRVLGESLKALQAQLQETVRTVTHEVTEVKETVVTLESQVAIPGPAGAPGETGATGPAGATGATGLTGAPGDPCSACVFLQGSSPGSAQSGHFNITGAGVAGSLQAATFLVGTAGDVSLYRSAADTLKTDDHFHVGTTLQVGIGNRVDINEVPLRVTMTGSGQALQVRKGTEATFRLAVTETGTLNWGDGTNPQDTNLYRSAAGALQTDGKLGVGVAPGTYQLQVQGTSSGDLAQFVTTADAGQGIKVGVNTISKVGYLSPNLGGLYSFGFTDAAYNPQLTVKVSDNKVYFGNPLDTNLYRGGIDRLKTDDNFEIADGKVLDFPNRGAANTSLLLSSVTGDITARYVLLADGKQEWGPGTAARDTNLYRSSANTLKTDGNFLIQTVANSTTAFQIQNSAAASLFSADTSGMNLTLNGANGGELGTWSTNANALPAARYGTASVTAGGYAYVIGGTDGTSASAAVYYAKLTANGSTGSWSTNANALPAVRSDHSAAVGNGYVYVTGGATSSGCSAGLNTVYYAKLNSDGSTGAWTTNASTLPGIRCRHASLVANGYLYVVAGETGSGGQNTVYYAKLNADGSTGAWSTNANALPALIYKNTAAVANGYLYAIGGLVGGTGQTAVYYAKLNADGSTGAWSTNNMPVQRGYHSSVVMNGYLYVIGGDVSCCVTPQTTVYYAKLNGDGTLGTWSLGAQALPGGRYGHGSIVANGFVYVLGGSNNAAQTTVYYASGSRIKAGGSLDLIGLGGQTLAEGGTGGSLTAGNTFISGTFEVTDLASFWNGVSVDKELTVGGTALFKTTINSTTAFQVQNSAGAQALNVDTTALKVQTADLAALTVGTTTGNTLTTVDATTGSFTSMKIGSDGFARIAYIGGGLKFAQCTNADCSTSSITTVDALGGFETSLALGSDGFARIAYRDNTNLDLKFAQCTNAACTTKNLTTVDSTGDVGRLPSIIIGSDGFARIAYRDSTNFDLKFVQCTNAACSTNAITTVSTDDAQDKSIALGSDGFARIAYLNGSGGGLKFVQCTNDACTTSNINTVDSIGTAGGGSSLALGSDGFARISYRDSAADSLKFAQCTNATCTTNSVTTVDKGPEPFYTSLALGSDGFARIAYYDSVNANLKFARCTNAACTTNSFREIDTAGDVGAYPALALSSDLGRISYRDATNNSLKFARLVTTDGDVAVGGSSLGQAGAQYGQLYATGINSNGTFTVSGSGVALFKNSTDSAFAFQVQNSAGTAILIADTTNLRITLGSPSATPVLLVLGNKNTAGDPACTNGALYYNSNSHQIRSCINGTWENLAAGNELAYVARTTSLNLTTTDQEYVAAPAITFDGNTTILVEFWAPYARAPKVSGQNTKIKLYDGGTILADSIAAGYHGDGTIELYGGQPSFKMRLTPTAGSHTYKIMSNASSTTGGPIIGGDTGTGGTYAPGFIRITRAQ